MRVSDSVVVGDKDGGSSPNPLCENCGGWAYSAALKGDSDVNYGRRQEGFRPALSPSL